MTSDTAINYIEKHFNYEGLTDSQKKIVEHAFRKIRDAVEVAEILKISVQINKENLDTLKKYFKKEWLIDDEDE